MSKSFKKKILICGIVAVVPFLFFIILLGGVGGAVENAVDESSKYISSFTHQTNGAVVSYDSINPDTPTSFASGKSLFVKRVHMTAI